MPPPNIPHLDTQQQRDRAESLLVAAYRSGITDPKELANFMGQVQHESQNFSRLEENLNYSGDRLNEVFPGRNGLTAKRAEEIAGMADRSERHQAVAEQIYGGAWGKSSLGNIEKGDGYTFRGRGYIQLTGRDNYNRYAKAVGLDLTHHPELAAQQGNAERLATSYWQSTVHPNVSARTDPKEAGSIINTGEAGNTPKGLTDRRTFATAWTAALDKGYLQDALYRHPEALSQLNDTSRELLRDSERHVRSLADKHKLPWDRGMDNTVFVIAQQAREHGMTNITHLKVVDGQIQFAQQAKGEPLRESQIDAKAAANTDVNQSVTRMVHADQAPARGATPAVAERAQVSEPALAH